MTPNQKKFWNILREPYIKNCRNCKYRGKDDTYITGRPVVIWDESHVPCGDCFDLSLVADERQRRSVSLIK